MSAFLPSVNTQLSSKNDPVAPPSPSKSPIGVGAPGSSSAPGGGKSSPSAATTSSAFGPPSTGVGLGAFGGTGGIGGLGGLGGLGSSPNTPTNQTAAANGTTPVGGVGGLNSSAAIFSATNGETKSVSAAANAPIFKPSGSGKSDFFSRVNASMTGTRLKLSVRVDQPVESVSTRTTAYIRGLGPVEKDAAIWSWQRSSLSVACMNAACPFNHSKATMECVCFETTFRYCSAQCLKMSWKEINSTKSKDISTIQKRKETKNKGKDNEEALLESDMDVEGKKHIVKLRDWLKVVLPRLCCQGCVAKVENCLITKMNVV